MATSPTSSRTSSRTPSRSAPRASSTSTRRDKPAAKRTGASAGALPAPEKNKQLAAKVPRAAAKDAATARPPKPAASKTPATRTRTAGAKPASAGAAGTAAAKSAKAKKPKLVRDSFTIPKAEYAVLETLKQRAQALVQPAKKSELLRAGIKALAAMNDADLKAALAAVPAVKTGRPRAE